jgi:ubiquinone/menaquinone biosynthesis C-methylase UbiE
MTQHLSNPPTPRRWRVRPSIVAGATFVIVIGAQGLFCPAQDHGHSAGAVKAPAGGSTPSKAEQYERFVEEKLKHTYPATAARMLAECGGIREGICIDLGCGAGHLDVELARRTRLTIVGLDIDPDMRPLFERRIHAAGLDKRVWFVLGDAQKLPFPDDYADIIVSRGMLIFVPDIPKCLREVDRVLKPTGVALLGGRYLYAPREAKISVQTLKNSVAESLRQSAARTGIPTIRIDEDMGQWVEIRKTANQPGMSP